NLPVNVIILSYFCIIFLIIFYFLFNFFFFFFFFQAEDGIRDRNVTGVQTCALPIYLDKAAEYAKKVVSLVPAMKKPEGVPDDQRSEERRVGKECRSRRWREQ